MRDRDTPAGEAEILAFLGSPDQLARADYQGIIDRWGKHLAPGRLFVAPYARIGSDPEALLDDINDFLGIHRLGGASKRHVTTRQNVTEGGGVPDSLRASVEATLADATLACRELLGEIGPGRVY